MAQFLTSKENIALNLIFEWLGESRFNRTDKEYAEIAPRLQKHYTLCQAVNERLREIAAAGEAPYEICYFRKGDANVWYEPYPKSLSITTVRTALAKSGMSQLRKRSHWVL